MCNNGLCVYICVHSVESSHAVVETAWEDSLNETLENDVQETRKMVSALQVNDNCGFNVILYV